jgi:hypothetical protein
VLSIPTEGTNPSLSAARQLAVVSGPHKLSRSDKEDAANNLTEFSKRNPRMLRYHLDDLGPYQFEKLAQSALKASLGLGVESWGNRGDWGRDSYARGPLRFPDPKVPTPGPFVFQVKFVEGANSAGSRPGAALLSSSSKEVERIQYRIKKGIWKAPAHFTFITNSLVGADHREKIRSVFQRVMISSAIHVWGGDDICDILYRHSRIARSFPQLLSIRDLDELISFALTKESRERSETALQIATELVPVFSPTSSYEHAWSVLRKHHFAVLEGPPEVGKSSIAWMVGLTQAAQGWETVVCQTPGVFFHMILGNRSQVFIADDAFGRGEYDPTRMSIWEADLDLVLHRLDRRHWLIWTSRKHILERACARMDAQGMARSFPDPGAILVDVSELSIEERALILFRHARSAGLEKEAKTLIRKYAGEIIVDPEFTPERIRRFVDESLPVIVSRMRSDGFKDAQVMLAVREALRNPTKQMRVTFQKLPPAYKWFLVALLEVPQSPQTVGGNVERLKVLYEAYCPDEGYEPFTEVMDHLTEAFVKVRKERYNWGGPMVDWIHPSYRDLVIEELIQDSALRNTFLRRASLEGVKLAVSDTGGQYGDRRMPLIRSAESWDVLEERCLSLIASDAGDREVLEILGNAASEDNSGGQGYRWNRLLMLVCTAVQEKWNRESRIISAADLQAFAKARRYAQPTPALPDLLPAWEALEEHFLESLRSADIGRSLDYDAFDDLTAFAHVVMRCAPEFLREKGFPNRYETEIAAVFSRAKSEIDEDPDTADPEELRNLAGRADSAASAVKRLGDLSESHESEAKALASLLRRHSSALEESAAENEPPEHEDDRYESEGTSSQGSSEDSVAFDVARLFLEL